MPPLRPDKDERWLSQPVDSVTTTYTLDLNNGLTQVLDDETSSYLYGLSRLGEFDGAEWVYHLPDALGSVRQLADANAAIIRTETFTPYGQTHEAFGFAASNYAYTGEWSDATSLVYLRARYYAPEQGRFVSRDSWEGDYQQPLTLNRWNYVNANPINFTDPTGNVVCPYGWV